MPKISNINRVLYHGENDTQGFPMFFSTSKRFAADYGKVLEYQVNLTNVFDTTDESDVTKLINISTGSLTDPYDETEYKDWLSYRNSPVFASDTWEMFEPYIDTVQGLGYDGMRVFEGGVENYIAFDPNQVKPTIGNKGTFDPENPDITASVKAIQAVVSDYKFWITPDGKLLEFSNETHDDYAKQNKLVEGFSYYAQMLGKGWIPGGRNDQGYYFRYSRSAPVPAIKQMTQMMRDAVKDGYNVAVDDESWSGGSEDAERGFMFNITDKMELGRALRKINKDFGITAAAKPEVFLGGEVKTDWRSDIITEFKDTLKLIDPVDEDWDPSTNIYEELTDALSADEIVFYKGGEGSEGEQAVLDAADKEYEVFDDLDDLTKHLEKLSSIVLDIKVGDEILTGHWKNHRVKVKTITKGKDGMPNINGKPIMTIRIPKLMPEKKKKSSIEIVADVLKTAEYSHGAIMAPAPEELRTHILKELVPQIPEEHLEKDKEETIFGAEPNSHVTVLWGIETTPKDMDIIRTHFTQPLTIKSLSQIGYFDNEETAAYLKVDSPDLTKLHTILKKELPNVDDHDEYVPHITIAYLEAGKRLDITDITPFEWKVTKLIISKPDGTTEDIYAKGYEPEHEAVELISSVLKKADNLKSSWILSDGSVKKLRYGGGSAQHKKFILDNYPDDCVGIDQESYEAAYLVGMNLGFVRVCELGPRASFDFNTNVSDNAMATTIAMMQDSISEDMTVEVDFSGNFMSATNKMELGRLLREINKKLGKTAAVAYDEESTGMWITSEGDEIDVPDNLTHDQFAQKEFGMGEYGLYNQGYVRVMERDGKYYFQMTNNVTDAAFQEALRSMQGSISYDMPVGVEISGDYQEAMNKLELGKLIRNIKQKLGKTASLDSTELYHGTSMDIAKQIQKDGFLRPRNNELGQWSKGIFGGNPSAHNKVYATDDLQVAEDYAKHTGNGAVVVVEPDWNSVDVDEDLVAQELAEGTADQELWIAFAKAVDVDHSKAKEAYAFQRDEVWPESDAELADTMIKVVKYLSPKTRQRLLESTNVYAFTVPLKVIRVEPVGKTAAANPDLELLPRQTYIRDAGGEGFIIDQQANGRYLVSMNRRAKWDSRDIREVSPGDIKAIWDKKTKGWVKVSAKVKLASIDFGEAMSTAVYDVLSEFIDDPDGKQSWTVVSASQLKMVWTNYAKNGLVLGYNEQALEEIADTVLTNIARLWANTELMGHTDYGRGMKENFEDAELKYKKGYEEKFADYVITENGQWRISDYGLDKLVTLGFKISEAQTAEEKLVLIDQALNVVHQRTDLAASFVEGGSATLSELSAA